MVVLIPHQTEELKLINFQKELISELNTKNTIFYRLMPLWIELPFINATTKEELKTFSKKIKDVRFKTLQQDKNTFTLCGTLLTDKKEYKLTLPILNKITHSGVIEPVKIHPVEIPPEQITKKNTPVENLKIFQLGIANQISENTNELSETIWVKL